MGDNTDTWSPDSAKTWDTAIPGQTDSHPGSCVTWTDAMKFTEWLTTTNGEGWTCTLPTAAQWAYAARGTGTPCTNHHPDNYGTIADCRATGAVTITSTGRFEVLL